jgi:hypothetical protein
MKKLLLLFAILLFSGSSYYSGYIPILMFRSDLESSVRLTDSVMTIRKPGRIYLYQNWLMLVEKFKGVHLIDNSDPANPVRKGFLRVPGCQNVAVGNGTLYVDNAVDLVGVKINFTTMEGKVVARKKLALPEIESPEGYLPWKYARNNRQQHTEIVGWISYTDAL